MNWVILLAVLYSLSLTSWFIAFLIWGDHWGWLSLLNMFAIYLFIPLPFFSILLLRNPQGWLNWLFVINWLIFIGLWGKAFLPKIFVPTAQPTLKFLTYNVLGYNPGSLGQIETIRQTNADVVTLQELNTELAQLITKELSDQYPYQILDAEVGVNGMGTLSKFPLHRIGTVPDLGWVGQPQWLELEWRGYKITLINFHMAPTNSFAFDHVQETNRLRQEEARWLVAQIRPNQPVILAGDSNSAPLSDSYHILARSAQDAWLVAGWGLGHTFPGRSGPGSSRPQVLGLAVPKWLLRIDYIFSTPPLHASSARLALFDGVSDHRGVIAEFVLLEKDKFAGSR
ncbi:MAG: endonuclease/exonuclease/phosphatase family protein [Anaerolineales bacterium]